MHETDEDMKRQNAAASKLNFSTIALFVIPVLFITMAAIPSKVVDIHAKVPERNRLDLFPLQIEGWSGSRQYLEQIYLEALTLSDYATIDYKDSRNRAVNLYIAYYESQLKGKGIHLPDVCLPGGGWFFKETGTRDIRLHNDQMVRVNRIVMEKEGVRELTYYWFPQRGRAFSSVWQLRVYSFWDAITRGRSDGALLRLITPVYGQETVQDADARLQGFTKEIVPVLKEYIPE